MSDDGGQQETTRRIRRARAPRKPKDRRKARARLLAVAGGELAFMVLLAGVVAQWQPGFMSQLSGQLTGRLPSGSSQPNATALPSPTPTTTPRPQLPNAATAGDFGNTVTLFSYTTRGVTHKMLGITHKNGLFYALDRAHFGRGPVWERSVSASATLGIYSSASFDGNMLYVTGSYTVVGRNYCSNAIHALDPRTGADIWACCLTEGLVYGAVTSAPGVIVVGAGPWKVVMSSETGATLFRYHDPGVHRLYGAATIACGLLLQGNSDGTLYAFGPSSSQVGGNPS
jgi:hypothetical protein